MHPHHRPPPGLTAPEVELRDRLLSQCEVWLSRHIRTLYAAWDQARIEHAGDETSEPPQLRVLMRADLIRYEPTVSIVGNIVFDAEDLEP